MRLALRNIMHDRLRFLLTIAGISFSAFLMIFQGSLLAGFERAASRVIDSIDADLWVMSRGVQAFDFAPPLPLDYSALVRGVPGVGGVETLAAGFAFWQRPNGTRKTIILVGAGKGLPGKFPVSPGSHPLPEHVIVDESDRETLGLSALPTDVEISSRRVRVDRSVIGFGSFLGSPYVFGRLSDVRVRLGLGEDKAMFLLLQVEARYGVGAVQNALRTRMPELDVLDKAQFSNRAKLYWTTQTGAGGALLTAAVLGFIVGVLIISQTVYATTMENIEEFATLKALGASSFFIARIVVVQALFSAILGCVVGILISIPATSAARQTISWIYTPWQLLLSMAATTVILAALASVTAARAALAVEPGRVFRA